MATVHKTPGVYVKEISRLPLSVAPVETAIPSFTGFTEKDAYNGSSLLNKPARLNSLKEYEAIFGMPQAVTSTIIINADNTLHGEVVVPAILFSCIMLFNYILPMAETPVISPV